jgi:hypothetical protein
MQLNTWAWALNERGIGVLFVVIGLAALGWSRRRRS